MYAVSKQVSAFYMTLNVMRIWNNLLVRIGLRSASKSSKRGKTQLIISVYPSPVFRVMLFPFY